MEPTTEQPNQSPSGQATSPGAITPALVREVADKVYQLMLRDLRVEHERQRRMTKSGFSKRGM